MANLQALNEKVKEYDKQLYMESLEGEGLSKSEAGIWAPKSGVALYRVGERTGMTFKLKEFPTGVGEFTVMDWIKKNDNRRKDKNTVEEMIEHNEGVKKDNDKKIKDTIDYASKMVTNSNRRNITLMK